MLASRDRRSWRSSSGCPRGRSGQRASVAARDASRDRNRSGSARTAAESSSGRRVEVRRAADLARVDPLAREQVAVVRDGAARHGRRSAARGRRASPRCARGAGTARASARAGRAITVRLPCRRLTTRARLEHERDAGSERHRTDVLEHARARAGSRRRCAPPAPAPRDRRAPAPVARGRPPLRGAASRSAGPDRRPARPRRGTARDRARGRSGPPPLAAASPAGPPGSSRDRISTASARP